MKTVFDKRKIFREKTEARAAEAGAGILLLKARIKKYRAEKKERVNRIVEDLEKQHKQIDGVLKDMKKKGLPTWEEYGKELSSMTEQLRKKIKEARVAIDQ